MAVRIAAVLVSLILHVIATSMTVWSYGCTMPEPVFEIEVEVRVGG